MWNPKTEPYETINFPLPETLRYSPTNESNRRQDRRWNRAHKLIMEVLDGLQTKAADSLRCPPVKMTWFDEDGDRVWSQAAPVANRNLYLEELASEGLDDLAKLLELGNDGVGSPEKFSEAMLDALNDKTKSVYALFQNSRGDQLRFCVRFV
jgi:hypothetical protein